MSLDLIKQYLIGFGFKVDDNSVKDAENSITGTEERIKEFNKESNKGFLETNETIKNLFSLFKSTSLGTLFPELQKPFNTVLKDIQGAEKAYKKLKSSNEEVKNKSPKKRKTQDTKEDTINSKDKSQHKKETPAKREDSNKIDDTVKVKEPRKDNNKSFLGLLFKDILTAKKNLTELKNHSKGELKGVETSSEELAVRGGKSILGFSLKSVGNFMLIAGAIATVTTLSKKLFLSLNELGNDDIGYEKIARQLWTTKETARDVDSALKTLGVSMQDLWLSPTLMKQFNQLMKDSQELRLPPEFKDNIEVVKSLNLEFKRGKQILGLTFKWIGSYILKYCAGPLLKIKNGLHKFNDGLLKAVPYIGKVLGSTIGIILRGILMIGQIVTPIFSIISKFIKFIINLIDKIPGPIKNIIKIIGLIAAAILAGPLGAIIGVIAVIDDLFTFLRGGESVIGNVFNKFKDKGLSAIEFIKKIGAVVFAGPIKAMKFLFKVFEGGKSIIDSVFGFFEEKGKNVANIIEKIASVLMAPLKLVKDLFKLIKGGKSLIGNAFGFFKDKDKRVNIAEKVEYFNKNSKDGNAPQSYVTNRSTSNQTNTSNNKIDNNNVINVYGSGDPKVTANEVNRNLTGIHQRNLGGVF
ncbi:hypothetical protein [Clostridium ihumii]|uniref:hypothetical protein n=1 Tax=Clostridium ihumii TaxID=1470356 RepID=UPI000555352D|nr:hypothetical protein [Clostridium ihumii]